LIYLYHPKLKPNPQKNFEVESGFTIQRNGLIQRPINENAIPAMAQA
jgi:hypothetical protein